MKYLSKTIAFFLVLCLSFRLTAYATQIEGVSPEDWFHSYVLLGYEYGITIGIGDDAFRFEPQRAVTRAEFIAMLGRIHEMRGESITESNHSPFYHHYLAWAVQQGLIHGDESGNLMPHAPLNREQMAVIVDRYVAAYALQEYLNRGGRSGIPILDLDEISSWAYDAMWRMYLTYTLMHGTLVGGGVLFRPQANTSRAEAIAILIRLADAVFEIM